MKGSYDVTGGLKDQVNFLTGLVIALCAVLLVALGGFVQQWMAAKEASYEMLVDKINSQSAKMDILEAQCAKK